MAPRRCGTPTSGLRELLLSLFSVAHIPRGQSTMPTKPSATDLRAALRELGPCARLAIGFSLVSSLLVLAPSWYMLEVYDRVVNSRNALTLAMLTIAVLAAYALMEALEWVRSEIVYGAACALDQRLGRRVFDAAFVSSRKRLAGGGLQAMQDLRTVRDFLHSPALLASLEAPVALVLLGLIFAISPWLGAVALGAAVLQVLIGLLNRRSTHEPLQAANRSASEAQHAADRMAAQAPLLRAMAMTGALKRRWAALQDKAVARQAEASCGGGFYQAMSKLLQNLVGSALLGLSCWLLLHDRLNGGAGMLIVAGIFGGRVLAPFIQVVTQWQGVAAAGEAWSRLRRLLEALPVAAPAMPLPAPTGALLVDSIVASAPGQPAPILKGIAFALQRGEIVAVMGPSASGKSCLARVLLGLWTPVSGKVRLDGVDVAGWDRAELGPHLGYLPQGVELTEGTIADNISRFGRSEPATLAAAALAVGLDTFIAALPEGYDTWIGPNAAVLSGGQRQRVALARALYGDPTFVVLDEPDASLDDAGDAALVEALAACKQRGCTVVVMTHRAGVLAIADKVLLLREGQQQAFGPRDEVLAAVRQANEQARSPVLRQVPAAAPVPQAALANG
jgi:ATP-binding cassette subfamily C exporter for protease/lipase